MSRICELTGKGRLVGNNVSHANNKTKRVLSAQPAECNAAEREAGAQLQIPRIDPRSALGRA